jgi:hypothetical protein
MADKKFIRYSHHGMDVAVREDLKGTHRDVCLCYDCEKFKPGLPEANCPIANMVYGMCLMTGTVLPVYECPVFRQGERYQFTTKTGQ